MYLCNTDTLSLHQRGRSVASWLVVAVVVCVILAVLVLGVLGYVLTPPHLASTYSSAISTLRTLNEAQQTFASKYNSGFSDGFHRLGPPSSGPPDTNNADLVSPEMAGRAEGGTNNNFVWKGYRFTYQPGAPDAEGKIRTYTILARPLRFHSTMFRKATGFWNFFTDQTGVIRMTGEDRPATAQDRPI